jgi:hypothetical protein
MDFIWDRAILFVKKKGTDPLKGKKERKGKIIHIISPSK